MTLVTLDPRAELIGRAPAFESVLERLPALARASEPVLLVGEAGTGKERVARSMHQLGPRAARSFVPVACGALDEALVAQAAGGTLFVDEVETLDRRAQLLLLRVLEDVRSDLRVIAATAVRLEPLVESGRFHAGLHERLRGLGIELPPLRERQEDILPLAEHFLRKHQEGAPAARLSAQASAALLAFDWPGNVRELESAVVRGLRRARNGVIELSDCGLPAESRVADAPRPSYRELKRRMLEAFDLQYLTELMTEHRGNVSRAARAAGKERRDLGKLLKRHGLDPRSFA
jgi:DNA-binding NtrC family response regulator